MARKSKKDKAKQTVVTYLAPAQVDGVKQIDYDPETKVKDAFEDDLDFLLKATDSNSNSQAFSDLSIHEEFNLSIQSINQARKTSVTPEQKHITRKVKKEILDFDFDFSDDDDDEDEDSDNESDTIDRLGDDIDLELGLSASGSEFSSASASQSDDENDDLSGISDEEENIQITEERKPLTREEFDSLDAQLNRLTIRDGKVSRERVKPKPRKNHTGLNDSRTDYISKSTTRPSATQRKHKTSIRSTSNVDNDSVNTLKHKDTKRGSRTHLTAGSSGYSRDDSIPARGSKKSINLKSKKPIDKQSNLPKDQSQHKESARSEILMSREKRAKGEHHDSDERPIRNRNRKTTAHKDKTTSITKKELFEQGDKNHNSSKKQVTNNGKDEKLHRSKEPKTEAQGENGEQTQKKKRPKRTKKITTDKVKDDKSPKIKELERAIEKRLKELDQIKNSK